MEGDFPKKQSEGDLTKIQSNSETQDETSSKGLDDTNDNLSNKDPPMLEACESELVNQRNSNIF